MRLLTRYIIGQVLSTFLVTALALCALLLILGIAKEAISEGLSLRHVCQLLPYLLPNALLFAVPGAVLFSVCQVYGRMAAANEVLGVKSLGIHPRELVWPSLVIALLLSGLTVWLNDLAVSWGYRGAQNIVLQAIADIAYRRLEMQHSFSTRDFSVHVARLDQKKLIDATFSFQAGNGSPASTVTAHEAEIHTEPDSGVLEFVFSNGTVETGATNVRFPGVVRYEVTLDRVSRKGASIQSSAHLALSEIPAQIASHEKTIEELKQEMAKDAAFSMMVGDFTGLSDPKWTAQANRLDAERGEITRLRLEAPRRVANGFSCVCFALVGIPMAIRLRNADFLMSFFLCFLPILLVYYPLMMYAVDRAKAGAMPIHLIWLPNAALSLWSIWLFRRVLRY
jgi:lipopolysaccharide export system permease protein